jgi:hypothetical protein
VNPELIAARWYFGDLKPEEWPAIAAGFLERGMDGQYLKSLAERKSPTRADIEETVTGALAEIGVAGPMSRNDAGLMLAREEAKSMLRDRKPPHEIASRLWFRYGLVISKLHYWRALHIQYKTAGSPESIAAAEQAILAAANRLASE